MITMARHRGRGKGSVYYDKSRDRWVASVSLEQGRRKQSARTEAEAEKLLRGMLDELEESGSVSAKNCTVGAAIADYLAHPPPSWKTSSTLSVNRTHAAHLTAALGRILLTRLTVQQVEDHLAAEGRRGMSRSTVADQLFLLRLVIRRAQKKDLVGRNVAELADLPAGLPVRRSRSMTVEQMDALLGLDTSALTVSAWWHAWLSVALLCGTRPGETGALRWDDIRDGVLWVRAGLQETGDGLAVGSLKTPTSRRAMQIPGDVAVALAAWKREQAQQRLAAGPVWHDLGLIFATEIGEPVNRQRLNREFRAVCEAAAIGRWVPRECRHTFVSVMDDQGADIEEISDAVGHVNSTVTKKVYRHQISPVISGVAARMNNRKRATS
jgi:integrase